MAAAIAFSIPLPRPAISQRKLEANRRNAQRSTGPRTIEGKARVARNAVKHGFFAGIERWSEEDRHALVDVLEGLRDEFKPTDDAQAQCVVMMATTSVRLAMAWRYEAVAAREHHLKCERELNDRITNASPLEAAHLEAGRETLKQAGLWRPILPDERTMRAIARYEGSLNRLRTRAYSTLMALQEAKRAGDAITFSSENAKTNPTRAMARVGPEAAEGPQMQPATSTESGKTKPPRGIAERCPERFAKDRRRHDVEEIAKIKPSQASVRVGPEAAEGPRRTTMAFSPRLM